MSEFKQYLKESIHQSLNEQEFGVPFKGFTKLDREENRWGPARRGSIRARQIEDGQWWARNWNPWIRRAAAITHAQQQRGPGRTFSK